MATPIRTLVALDAGLTQDSVAASLPNDADIELVGVIEGIDDSWRTLEDSAVDVLVIGCLGYSDRVLFLIESSVRQDPSRPILVLSQGSPNGFVRRVFEVGADDILMLPQTREQVKFAIQKALARKHGGRRSGADLGRLIVVLGPKGGTGKTLTASNLAVALQEFNQRVVLVDLDLQFGDIGLCMGLSPEKTIHDLVVAGGTLDHGKLEDFLTDHESGVRVLLAPSRPDYASAVTVEAVREIYGVLQQRYDFVIVDTPPGFTPEVIASIDLSNDLVMVGMLDSLSLKNTKLGLETLELMGYDSGRISVVLNRADTRIGISREDVATIVARTPDVLVPSDREIPKSLTDGIPIVLADERSDAAAAFRSLAALYVASANGSAPSARSDGFAAARTDPREMLRTLLGRR